MRPAPSALRREVQRAGVDAEALAAGARAVVEDVAQVPAAARAQTTSVRTMPCELSVFSSTASATIGSVKLGQPVPESNFVSESNSSAPQPRQR